MQPARRSAEGPSLAQDLHGTWVQITALKKWTAHQQVHNLTVNDLHTYYVEAGDTPVLVHNCDFSRHYTNAAGEQKGIVANVDEDGLFNTVVEAEKGVTPRGGEMFKEAFDAIGGNASGIRGAWFGSGTLRDNLDSFNAALRGGASMEEAALNHTFTGKMASRRGFGNSIEFESLRGMFGEYTEVIVVFR